MHKFNPKNKKILDNEWRREHFPPKETLEKLGLTENDNVVDIGCGVGYFTIPAAEMVNVDNKVYAIDISQEMLDEVQKRVSESCISNIETIQNSEYDLKLDDQSVSFAIIVNVLHEINDRKKMLKEIDRILTKNGKIAIIEWSKNQEKPKMGPPMDHRIGKDEVEELCNDLRLKVVKEIDFKGNLYGLVISNS